MSDFELIITQQQRQKFTTFSLQSSRIKTPKQWAVHYQN